LKGWKDAKLVKNLFFDSFYLAVKKDDFSSKNIVVILDCIAFPCVPESQFSTISKLSLPFFYAISSVLPL